MKAMNGIGIRGFVGGGKTLRVARVIHRGLGGLSDCIGIARELLRRTNGSEPAPYTSKPACSSLERRRSSIRATTAIRRSISKGFLR